jgi:hypothetical protein
MNEDEQTRESVVTRESRVSLDDSRLSTMAAIGFETLRLQQLFESVSLNSIQHNQTMVTSTTSPTSKRHKSGTVELEASHDAVDDVINSILNVDREAFKEFFRGMDWGYRHIQHSKPLLSTCSFFLLPVE